VFAGVDAIYRVYGGRYLSFELRRAITALSRYAAA